MKEMRLFRTASGAGAAGALLISYATSCSVNGTVLGRWSVLLAVMTVAFILLAAVFLFIAFGFGGAYTVFSGHLRRLPDSGPGEWLFRNSAIVQMLYRAKKVYLDGVPVVSTAVDPEFREVPMTEPEERLPDDLHDLLEDPGFYRERIRRLIRECRSQGIEPVFFTQPLLYENTEYWQGIEECARFYRGSSQTVSAASFSLMLETLNDDLVQVCTEEGAAVFDLAAEIPYSRDMFYNVMHMTEQGADLVGWTVAGYLTSYFMEAGIPWQED